MDIFDRMQNHMRGWIDGANPQSGEPRSEDADYLVGFKGAREAYERAETLWATNNGLEIMRTK